MPNSDRKPLLLDFEKPLAELETRIHQIRELAAENGVDVTDEIRKLEARSAQLRQEIFSSLSPMQRLQLARHPRRPSTLDYIQAISDEWIELHGDRRGTDDPALVGGIARIDGLPTVIIGHQKGRDTKDNIARNFGMAAPGGYRKALRLMEHADRFSMPIFTFIDTPGAWAGLEAEQLGQGEAIACNLREMFRLDVPIICTVIGEGGSGGALGIGVGERLLMLEHSVYTVATPEACAAILWKDSGKANFAGTGPQNHLLGFEKPRHSRSNSTRAHRRRSLESPQSCVDTQTSFVRKLSRTDTAYWSAAARDAVSKVSRHRCIH